MTHSPTIRILTEQEWPLWREIRLEAIRTHPEAFYGDYDEELALTDAQWQGKAKHSTYFVAEHPGQWQAGAGLLRYNERKLAHRAYIFGIYVRESARGNKLADALMEAILHHANGKLELLTLGVGDHNAAAIRIYERHGFVACGRTPNMLKHDGRYYHEITMVRHLGTV